MSNTHEKITPPPRAYPIPVPLSSRSVIVKLNDQTFTLYKEDDRLNLSGIGIESFVNDVNTESGAVKNQNVPPTTSLTLPYQATPL